MRQIRGMRSSVISVSAPVGGWNARDSQENMPSTDAVVMDNWYPAFGSVDLRGGYAEYVGSAASLDAASVQTLAEFHAGATRKFVAAANGKLWDITTAATPVELGSGYSSDRWEWTNFNAQMGLVNGADAPQVYDGSTVSAMTFGSASGYTPANFVGIETYRSRTWFWESNSQSAWYSPVNTMGGALKEFPLSRVGSFGGNLTAVGSWSLGGASDTWGGGGDIRDVIVFVMSSGDTIIYEGSDPGDATDWFLVGVYRIGRPLDVRGLVKVGDDLVIATTDGYIPMSQVLRQGRLAANSAISDKIRDAVRKAADSFASNTGWQAILYEKGGYVLFNVPRTSTTFEQHVMNVATGAWCRFTNQNGLCWGTYNGDLYFGLSNGKVMKADSGTSDDGGDIGGTSGALVRQAHQHFQQPMQVTAIRPILRAAGDIPLGISLESEFRANAPIASEITLSSPTQLWNNIDVFWEEWEDNWNVGTKSAFSEWIVRSVRGLRVNPRIRVNAQIAIEWIGTDYRITPSNAL